jgi:hypothetical protein
MSASSKSERTAPVRNTQALRWAARIILLGITAFWVWFCILDGLGDMQTLGVAGLLMMLPAALVCLALLYVCWRWEWQGGLLLLGFSVLGVFLWLDNMHRITATGAARFTAGVQGLLIFVLPFLAAGSLLLAKVVLDRRGRRQPNRGSTAG